MLNRITGKDNRVKKKGFTDDDVKEQLNYMSRRMNIEREKFEH